MASDKDLLIAGAGSLGRRVGASWRRLFPAARIVAETRTEAAHGQLRRLGLEPRLGSEPPLGSCCPHVLICFPPSQQQDYAAECRRALGHCAPSSGKVVLVSSTAVYAESDGGICREGSPLSGSERAGRLLAAEAVIRAAAHGIVVRLAGLYDEERGPQRVFLRQDAAPRRPDGLVNLIHYDDAAALCVLALERGRAGAIYLGSDGSPLTRQQLVAATWRSRRYRSEIGDRAPCRFTATSGPLGRRCDSAATRQELGWQPEEPSFLAWLDRS